MSARLDRPATRDGLFLWIMHRFAEVFEEHAVIKGCLLYTSDAADDFAVV